MNKMKHYRHLDSYTKTSTRLSNLHAPPVRRVIIPFCGTRLEDININKCRRGWGRGGLKVTVKDDGNIININNESNMRTFKLAKEEAGENAKKCFERRDMVTVENRTVVGEDGVLVTTLEGWEPAPFEPIQLVNFKKTEEDRHPSKVLRTYAMYFVRLANVIAPNNFCMEFIIDPPKDGCKTWEESLQQFYNDPENALKYKMCTMKPYVGRMYVTYEDSTAKWHRIRVHQLDLYNQTVVAVYMDQLLVGYEVSIDSLCELHPKYANWHKYPVNGSLRDIRPRYSDSDDEMTWPDEANEFFKSYVADKTFQAFVVGKRLDMNDNVYHAHEEDRFTRLSVILFEVGSDIPVNAWMVQKGYARPIRSMTGCLSQLRSLHGVDIPVESPYQIQS